MKKYQKFLAIGLISMSLLGCANMTREESGNVIGALIGGALAYELGKDSSNKEIWVATGIIGGAIAGGHYAVLTEPSQRMNATNMHTTLESIPDNAQTKWINPNTNESGTMTVVRTNNNNGTPCREFTQTIYVGGKAVQGYGTACRQADGSWKIIQ